MSPDTLLLLSGGLDSMTLAYHLAAERRLAYCVFFDYGQPAAEREKNAFCKFVCESPLHQGYKIDGHCLTLYLDGMQAMSAGAGASGPRVVPARNLVLIARAVNMAQARGLAYVALGATDGDRAAYVDCQEQWLDRLSWLTDQATGVRLIAPFVRMSKREVADRALELGVPLERTWSCYSPTGRNGRVPCRKCNACVERAAALKGYC